ncbi:MAG: putative phage tail protein [Acutalibacteraceae bacterium]
MGKSLDNMLKRMAPLPMYSLSTKSIVYKELSTYGAMLDKVIDELKNLVAELNINTATDEGLSLYEKIWGLPRTDLTQEQRRNAIEKRLGITYDKCTVKNVIAFFESLGAEVQLTEVNEKYRVYVYVSNGSQFSLPVRKYITSQAKEFFPAHLEIFVDYRAGNWDTLDSKGTLFNTYDSFKFTWDRVEHFE